MITTKELSLKDIEQIKTLYAAIFTAEPWNDDWSDPVQLHEYITDLIGNRNSLTVGLYEDGELIGLSLGAIIHWYSGTEYYIQEFCVRTDRQGKGLGTAFLKAVEEPATPRGAKRIFLQTERTAPAFEFYRKNGFSELEGHVSLSKGFE